MLARAVAVGALLSLCGTLLFRTLLMPPGGAREAARALGRLTWGSLAVAAAGLAAWTLLQSAELAGARGPAQTLAALPTVLIRTRFGRLELLQLGLVAASGAALARGGARGLRIAAVFAALAVAAEAGHGHAMATGGVLGPLFWVDMLHLLSAAGWVGGLAPLLLVVRLSPRVTAAAAARRFSPFGKWCVAGLAGSALVQGWVLVGSIAALFGTPYGWAVLVKTGLFGLLSVLAVVNRYRLAPALRGASADASRRRLAASILSQTALGAVAVIAAAVLSGLVPGMDRGAGLS